jgi:uroporphyrinogen decarboxylase
MTSRERVQAAVRFEPPDQLPCNESLWEQTLTAWRQQGMPSDAAPADHFGFDLCHMYLDASPRFEQRVLARHSGLIRYQDRFGYTVERPEGRSATLRFLEHKTTDRAAWERIQPRFALADDPAEPARIDDASYFGHLDPYPSWDHAAAKYRRLRATDRYMLFVVYGPWEATWRHRGMESLLLDVGLQPDWVREMAETYARLVVAILKRCLALGMCPDGVFLIEDLGAKKGPFISPASWRAVLGSPFASIGRFAQEQGINFWMHTDGDVRPLLDPLVDCGVQVLNPLEAKAGMDALELRRRFGRRLAFYGNIDATKMYGPKPALEAELRRKVPLARGGGYIFHSDHSVPPQVTYERYRWLLGRARAIFHGAGEPQP